MAKHKKAIGSRVVSTAELQLRRALELHQAGKGKEAEAAYKAVLRRDPTHARPLYLLAQAYAGGGNDDAAIRTYERCLAVASEPAKVYLAMGNVYAKRRSSYPKAIECYQKALRLNPKHAAAYNNLGLIFYKLSRLREAEVCFRQALACDADHAGAYNNLGNVLQALGRYPEALDCFRKKIQARPNEAEGYNNLAILLHQMGRRKEADFFYGRAHALSGDTPITLFNAAITLLARGQLTEGWAAYERRFETPAGRNHAYPYPTWDGSDLGGKTVLVFNEQGLGDELLFVSCVNDVIARAEHCIVQCEPRLEAIFKRSFPEATVLGTGRNDQATMALLGDRTVDCCVAQGSLPRFFRPTLDSFPQHQGYLKADSARVRELRAWVEGLGPGLKVGICWRSMSNNAQRRKAYTQLAEWDDVLKIPGLVFVNLQYDNCEKELDEAFQRTGVRVHQQSDLDLMNDLDGAAALSCALDLVVSVNTVVGALSGALGVPTLRLGGEGWTTFGSGRLPWFPQTEIVDFRSGGRDLLSTRLGAWLALLAIPEWQGEDLGGTSLVVHGAGADSIISCLPFLAALAERYGERCVMLSNPLEGPCLRHAFPSVQVLPDERFSSAEQVDALDVGPAVRIAVDDLPRLLGEEVPVRYPQTLVLDAAPHLVERTAKFQPLRVGLWYCWEFPKESILSTRYGDVALWREVLDTAGVALVNLNPQSDMALAAQAESLGELSLIYQEAESWVERAAVMSGLDVIISAIPAPLCASLGVPVWHPELVAGAYPCGDALSHVKVWGQQDEPPSVIIERMASGLREAAMRKKG